VTEVLACFVQKADFDRAEVQVRQYGRHFSANGGRIFVMLFTPTDPTERFYFFETKILDGGFLHFGQ
jgi:hypothetical protein